LLILFLETNHVWSSFEGDFLVAVKRSFDLYFCTIIGCEVMMKDIFIIVIDKFTTSHLQIVGGIYKGSTVVDYTLTAAD
jgi:hypothetical protein